MNSSPCSAGDGGVSDVEPVLLDRYGEILPLALRQSLEDRLLHILVEPAGNRDLDRSAIGFVHRHAVTFDLLQRGHNLGRCIERMPKRGRSFIVRSEQITRTAEFVLHRLDMLSRLVLLEAHGHQLVGECLRRRAERGFGDEGICLVEV